MSNVSTGACVRGHSRFARGTKTGPLRKITVLLVDDHPTVRKSLCALLDADGHATVVGQARNGREGVQLARPLRPDVILMDIAMPVLNGLEATREILAANSAAKVVILSAHSDDEYIECINTVGAVGFLEKQTAGATLAKAIREVANGNRFFSPAIARRITNSNRWARNDDGVLKPNDARLTSRETAVLKLVAEGQGNKQVATTLGLSIAAVEKHRRQTLRKLNRHENADLTHYASTQGITKSEVRLTLG